LGSSSTTPQLERYSAVDEEEQDVEEADELKMTPPPISELIRGLESWRLHEIMKGRSFKARINTGGFSSSE
jgi:hypothetical protein